MKNIDEYVLYYEFHAIFDLEGLQQMDSSFGSYEVKLKVGEYLNLPFYEENKSFIEKIEEIDGLIVVTLNIPCKPLWENDGEMLLIKENEVVKYYYGRTTLNTQTDYYFNFRIINKN